MSGFHKNHGPMTSGGSGSASQLTITNPASVPSATTARYHGLARGYCAASASDSRTDETNCSWPGATCRARTAARFASSISSSVTPTAPSLLTLAPRPWQLADYLVRRACPVLVTVIEDSAYG